MYFTIYIIRMTIVIFTYTKEVDFIGISLSDTRIMSKLLNGFS